MAHAGFVRVIKSDKGVTYHLPPAEYCRDTHLDVNAVHTAAVAAARSVHANSAVLVSQTEKVVWSNLKPASGAALRA
jgi:hypothetical protein